MAEAQTIPAESEALQRVLDAFDELDLGDNVEIFEEILTEPKLLD